jgi:AcrR family transcriptional regulator
MPGRQPARPSATTVNGAVDKSTEAALDDRREQILQAAAEVLRERGFPDTRVADVARRAGVSAPLVMYYFDSKDQLLTAALRYCEDNYDAAVTQSLAGMPTARARLEHVVRTSCGSHSIDIVLWLDIWSQAFRHPRVARDRYELDQRWRDQLADVVRQGVAAGEFRDVDPDDFAMWFSALLDGLLVQVVLRDPVVSADRAFDAAMWLASEHLGFEWQRAKRGLRGGNRRR